MSMGALDRHIKELAAEHVGGAHASADHCGPGTIDSCIGTLCPSETELHDPIASGGKAYPGCLGGDQALVVYDVEQSRFDELGFHDRSDDLDQRFSGKDNSTFRDCINISRKTEILQIVKKVLRKDIQSGQVAYVFLGEMKVFDVLDSLFQPGSYGLAAASRVGAVKNIKNYSFILVLVLKIALHHGELIKIGEQGQAVSVHSLYTCSFQNASEYFFIPYNNK